MLLTANVREIRKEIGYVGGEEKREEAEEKWKWK
jgi:hypothetical protein